MDSFYKDLIIIIFIYSYYKINKNYYYITMRYLVIVESPNKKDKIASYLNTISGHNFTVEASFGHIRYFEDGLKSIDVNNNFKPTYSVLEDKKKVVAKLKSLLSKVDEVLIATDPDREGEAIGFHIAYALGLNPETTKRISFNEITKTAIVKSFNQPRKMDYDLFNAQQARSELDLLIGFEISPVLWKFIKPGLSAGRCQSPALRLVLERENEINDFKSNKFYNLTGYFSLTDTFIATTIYHKKIESKDTVIELLPTLIKNEYTLSLKEKKNASHNPPAPFITSTIQQEASSRFGMSPKSTMGALQHLYEKGKITYLRTDSTSISQNFIDEVKDYLQTQQPGKFEQRTYASKVANAQEAHECIRPVSTSTELEDSFSPYDKKVFDLIRKRAIASQMIKYKEEIYNYELKNGDHVFTFTLKKVIEIGWKAMYEDLTTDEDGNQVPVSDNNELIKTLSKKLNNKYKPTKLLAAETMTKPKGRYTEAALIKELEERGIGRPSTFSNLVSTLLEREYVIKKTKDSITKIDLEELSIEPNKQIQTKTKQVNASADTNKLAITDIGKLVSNFMAEKFSNINSYDFTSEVESDLDKISRGEAIWYNIVKKVYQSFHPIVEELKKEAKELKESGKPNNISKRLLGVNPTNNKNIYAYLGRYGPCVQEGENNEEPKYAALTNEDSLDTITLERALELLSYPKKLGKHNGHEIFIKKGKFGLYLEHNKTKKSIQQDVLFEEAKELLSNNAINQNIIKEFSDIKVMNGQYGPYLKKGKENYKIPKDIDATKITRKQALEIIKLSKDAPKKTFKKFNKKNEEKSE